MNHLPIELLPFIIEKVGEKDLFECSKVCRSFYSATAPILWRSYCEKPFGYESPHRLLNCLYQMPPHPMTMYLQHLSLNSAWNNASLLNLIPHVGLVQDLQIANGRAITMTTLQRLVHHCPRLRSLRLGYFELTQSLTGLDLEQLDLRCCSAMSTSLFGPLVGGKLKRLTIANGYNGRCRWTEPTLKDMLRLDVEEIRFQDDTIDLVQHMVKGVWPRLTRLLIDSLGENGDDTLIPLVQTYCDLQHLALPGSKMTDATLDAMHHLPLTHLDIKFTTCITSAGIRRLVQASAQLVWIQLDGCPCSTLAFPEAGDDCLAYYSKDNNGHYMISYLDKLAIDKIRRNKDDVDFSMESGTSMNGTLNSTGFLSLYDDWDIV